MMDTLYVLQDELTVGRYTLKKPHWFFDLPTDTYFGAHLIPKGSEGFFYEHQSDGLLGYRQAGGAPDALYKMVRAPLRHLAQLPGDHQSNSNNHLRPSPVESAPENNVKTVESKTPDEVLRDFLGHKTLDQEAQEMDKDPLVQRFLQRVGGKPGFKAPTEIEQKRKAWWDLTLLTERMERRRIEKRQRKGGLR